MDQLLQLLATVRALFGAALSEAIATGISEAEASRGRDWLVIWVQVGAAGAASVATVVAAGGLWVAQRALRAEEHGRRSALRPYVLSPHAPRQYGPDFWIGAIKNAGPGVALDIKGEAWFLPNPSDLDLGPEHEAEKEKLVKDTPHFKLFRGGLAAGEGHDEVYWFKEPGCPPDPTVNTNILWVERFKVTDIFGQTLTQRDDQTIAIRNVQVIKDSTELADES